MLLPYDPPSFWTHFGGLSLLVCSGWLLASTFALVLHLLRKFLLVTLTVLGQVHYASSDGMTVKPAVPAEIATKKLPTVYIIPPGDYTRLSEEPSPGPLTRGAAGSTEELIKCMLSCFSVLLGNSPSLILSQFVFVWLCHSLCLSLSLSLLLSHTHSFVVVCEVFLLLLVGCS